MTQGRRRSRYSPQLIVARLRQVDALLRDGHTVPQACREIGIPELTYYRWRYRYGPTGSLDVDRFAELEAETHLLRRIIAEQAQQITELAAGETGQLPGATRRWS